MQEGSNISIIGCPSTEPQSAQQGGPDISLLDPALQKQWDHAANAHLGNILIAPHTNKKISWTCDQCPDGHPHLVSNCE